MGENKGKMGSYHACHNATNSMMAGGAGSAGYLVMPLPTLVAVLAIGGGDTAGMILAVAHWWH